MSKEPYIIAEAGCNHMGQMEITHNLINTAATFCRAGTIRFQKRYPEEQLAPEQYNAPHPNPVNSYGNTYGAHRGFFEFTAEQHTQLKSWCEEVGITYSTSVWGLMSAKKIVVLSPVFIKAPSARNNHFEMLPWLCDNYEGEIQLSFGMTAREEEGQIARLFEKRGRARDLILFGCTPDYSVPFEGICLLEISRTRGQFEKHMKAIGFSGHHLGVAVDVAAYTLGANVIEHHYTLGHTWKGVDHVASLESDGVRRLVRNLNTVYSALQMKSGEVLPIEQIQ